MTNAPVILSKVYRVRQTSAAFRTDFFGVPSHLILFCQVADDDKQTQKPGKRKAKEENEDAPKAKRKPQTKQSTARKKVTTKPKGIGKGASKGKKR